MRATWWVNCWRWILRMQIVVTLVAVSIGKLLAPTLNWRMALSWNAGQAALSQALVADAFLLVGFVCFGTMFFTTPIWILAEICDWRRERRERREWRALNDHATAERR